MKWIKKHKKLCIVLVIVLVLVILICRFIISMRAAAETMMNMMNQQETAAIERRSLVESVSATGSVVSVGSKNVTAEVTEVKSLSVSVQVGDVVEAGDLICLLDTSDLEDSLADSELTLSVTQGKMQLDLNSAQRSLTEAQTSAEIEQSRMEDQVASALKTYEEARESMNQAGSSYGNANYISTQLRLTLEDYQTQLTQVHEQISQTATISGSDADVEALEAEAARLEQVIADYQSQYNTALSTEQNLKSVYDSTITAVNNAYDAYESVLQSQEDSIRSTNSTLQTRQDSLTTSQLNAATSGMSDQKQIDSYMEQIAACTVTAPISGVVTAVNLEAGDNYNGGTIVTIEDISSYEVTVEIDEYDISKIEVGQRVVIKTNGTGDLELEGEVISIAPRASTGSDVTYTVKTSIDTPCEDLRMDMTAKLSIVISSRENVLTVPYAAVQTDEDGSYYIEVVEEEASATGEQSASSAANTLQTRRVQVTKGIESDYYVEVSGEGVTEGLEVIVPSSDAANDINTLLQRMGAMGGM